MLFLHVLTILQPNLINRAVMYINNSMHAGTSGGSVVDENGDVFGVITKRAVTSASQKRYPELEIPSGCTIELGLQLLPHVAKKMGGA